MNTQQKWLENSSYWNERLLNEALLWFRRLLCRCVSVYEYINVCNVKMIYLPPILTCLSVCDWSELEVRPHVSVWLVWWRLYVLWSIKVDFFYVGHTMSCGSRLFLLLILMRFEFGCGNKILHTHTRNNEKAILFNFSFQIIKLGKITALCLPLKAK